MTVDKGGLELLSSNHLFLERSQVGLDNGLLVRLARLRRLGESRVGPAPQHPHAGAYRAVRHGHHDDLQPAVSQQLLELVFAVEQDGLQGYLDPIVPQLG